jgi:stalled ribosome rescue protein Dom34
VSSHYHAVVWIDHHEARVIYFNADDTDETLVHPGHRPRQLHHHSGSPSGTHERGEPAYYRGVADALHEAQAFLVTGPSTAKTEFVTWLRSQAPQKIARMSGVETLQQVTDGQLVAEARRFFKGADRMKPQI